MPDFYSNFGQYLIRFHNSRKRGNRYEIYNKKSGKHSKSGSKEYSVVLVTCPRQIGKTTMLQKLRRLILYWSRKCFSPIEIKKTSNPGMELIKVFDLLDRSV